jgi:hypothetical protein
MKQRLRILFLSIASVVATIMVQAQCSICTKTASQLGEDAGSGLNAGILYLAAAPFAIVFYIGYRWWKNNSDE